MLDGSRRRKTKRRQYLTSCVAFLAAPSSGSAFGRSTFSPQGETGRSASRRLPKMTKREAGVLGVHPLPMRWGQGAEQSKAEKGAWRRFRRLLPLCGAGQSHMGFSAAGTPTPNPSPQGGGRPWRRRFRCQCRLLDDRQENSTDRGAEKRNAVSILLPALHSSQHPSSGSAFGRSTFSRKGRRGSPSHLRLPEDDEAQRLGLVSACPKKQKA